MDYFKSFLLLLHFISHISAWRYEDKEKERAIDCTEYTIYRAAYEGYDPKVSNMLASPDPGKKNSIFRRCYSKENDLPERHRFEDVAQNIDRMREATSCDKLFTYSIIENLDEYIDEMNSGITFASPEDAADVSPNFPDSSIIAHFGKGGKVILLKAKCITHSVGLTSRSYSFFTTNFRVSASNIFMKSLEKNPTESKKAVEDFIQDFGTHFMRTSYLGSKIVMQIKYTDSQIEKELPRLTQMASQLFFNQEGSIKDIHAKICERTSDCSPDSVRIVAMGPIPHNSSTAWRDIVAKAPVAIQFQLEKITSLFSNKWFSKYNHDFRRLGRINGSSEVNMTGASILDLLETYDWLNVGHRPIPPQASITPSDGIPSHPSSDEAKRVFTSLDDFYDILIITGGKSADKISLNTVTTVGTKPLPELPEPVYGHTLTYLGNGEILQLGGVGSTKALKINITASDPQWIEVKGLEVFNNMSYFTSVKLKDQTSPWIVGDSKLYTLTASGSIVSRDLPFEVTDGHCAVANDHHMFIIGGGENRNEVWVNSEPSDPGSFKRINNLSQSFRDFRCIWIGNEIYVTGGQATNSIKNVLRYATTIDVTSGFETSLNKLPWPLSAHGMVVWNGYPAFLGGLTTQGYFSDSFCNESGYYDSEELKWRGRNIGIDAPGHSYAILQLPSSLI